MERDTAELFAAMRRIFREQHELLLVACRFAATIEDGKPELYADYKATAGNILTLAESTLPASDLAEVYKHDPRGKRYR